MLVKWSVIMVDLWKFFCYYFFKFCLELGVEYFFWIVLFLEGKVDIYVEFYKKNVSGVDN